MVTVGRRENGCGMSMLDYEEWTYYRTFEYKKMNMTSMQSVNVVRLSQRHRAFETRPTYGIGHG